MAILEIDKITMRFGGLVAVKDFSLSLGDEEIVAIIGPNGAGKTTVFNMITGIISAYRRNNHAGRREYEREKAQSVCAPGDFPDLPEYPSVWKCFRY